MSASLAYVGPSATVLRNGRSVPPGSPIDPDELDPGDAEAGITPEREVYEAEGWLETIEETVLSGDALKARAAELNIEGRSSMSADELRTAIEEAEAEHAAQTTTGEEGEV